MQLVTAILWMHLLATVVLIGYYVLLALVILPATARLPRTTRIEVIAAVERRAMPFLVASLVVFLVTGINLMTGNAQYAGPGNVGGAWAGILLIKHLVIVGMLVLGSFLDGAILRAAAEADGSSRVTGLIVGSAGGMAVLGAVVLLLTAAAQTS